MNEECLFYGITGKGVSNCRKASCLLQTYKNKIKHQKKGVFYLKIVTNEIP